MSQAAKLKTRLVLQKSDLGILKTVAKDGSAYGLLEGVSISFLNANGLSLLEYDVRASSAVMAPIDRERGHPRPAAGH